MTNISETELHTYLHSLAAKTSTPGGGAAAAILAAQGCALISMVANFTEGERAATIAQRCEHSNIQLLRLADEDGEAFQQVMAAYRGKGDLQAALALAASVPAKVIEVCNGHQQDIIYLAKEGNQNLITDIGIAALSLHASLGSSMMNIRVNTRSMKTGPNPHLADALELAQNLSTQLLDVATSINTSLV